jgi:hypothetical protein
MAAYSARSQRQDMFPLAVRLLAFTNESASPCSTIRRVQAETEALTRLEDCDPLSLQTSLLVLKQAALAYLQLAPAFQFAYEVTPRMLGFNQSDQLRVWVHSHLHQPAPEYPLPPGPLTEKMLAESLFQAVSKCAQQRIP